ncbi:MAG: hypothetical protein ACRD0Q_02440 [Acidimicrobiales bacterium]
MPGVEFLGPYQGSGRSEGSYLLRRPDGQVVELSRLLYLVVAAADGRRDAAGLALSVTKELGRPVSAANVAYLIDHKLGPLGVLVGEGLPASPARTLPDPLLGLRFRVPLMPARAVGAVSGALRPLFAPAVVATVLAALAVVDVWVFLVHGTGPAFRAAIATPLLLPLLAVVLVAGATFHELGHAAASRYGGARPGAIGIGIYIYWLVFYNDLTDTYRLDRAGRLRADLGGIYFNAIFVLATVAAYAVTGFEALLVVVAVQHLEMAGQFWPFLRLDGYYVVSDLTGVPDLFPLVRPVLATTVARRPPSPAVASLRPGVRRAVTAWVIAAVAVGIGWCAWVITAGPELIATAVDSLADQRAAFSSALGAHDYGPATLAALQITLLALPLVGLVLTLAVAAARAGRSARPNRRDAISPAEWDRLVGTYLARTRRV